jgi:hypothetical protein
MSMLNSFLNVVLGELLCPLMLQQPTSGQTNLSLRVHPAKPTHRCGYMRSWDPREDLDYRALIS